MAPWPLISPVCPVVVRLIAFRFPNLLPNVLPVLRPVALMAREVKSRLTPEYSEKGKDVVLYYINPCPTKKDPTCLSSHQRPLSNEIALGINDIYPELIKHVEQIEAADAIPFYHTRFEYETCATGNASMWAMSGGEIADMDIDRSLAVSGMEETISYLEKIEMGLFQDIEYIEFRTCREGCLGGVLNAIDKYLAKGAVQKMIKRFGLGRRLHRDNILRMYEKGEFRSEKKPAKLTSLFYCYFGIKSYNSPTTEAAGSETAQRWLPSPIAGSSGQKSFWIWAAALSSARNLSCSTRASRSLERVMATAAKSAKLSKSPRSCSSKKGLSLELRTLSTPSSSCR